MRTLLVSLALLIPTAAWADATADRIVGVWEMQDPALVRADGSATLEFTKDGKVKVRIAIKGMNDAELNATFKVDGDKILMTRQRNGKEETEAMPIKSLTADTLVLVDKGKEVQLRRRAAPAPVSPNGIDPKKLLGDWEVVGQPGVTVKFAADGRIIMSAGNLVVLEGTYKFEKEKIALNVKGPEGKDLADTLTVKSLTDEKLVTVDSMGKEESLVRAK